MWAGVSAGSANLASFAAGQARRNRRFFEEYSQRKEYMSWGNWTHTGSFLDLDYIYGTLSNSDGEYPLHHANARARWTTPPCWTAPWRF